MAALRVRVQALGPALALSEECALALLVLWSVNPYGTCRAALDLPARLRNLDDERDEGSGEEADDPLPLDLPPLSAVRLSECARVPSEAASEDCGDDFGGAVAVS